MDEKLRALTEMCVEAFSAVRRTSSQNPRWTNKLGYRQGLMDALGIMLDRSSEWVYEDIEERYLAEKGA